MKKAVMLSLLSVLALAPTASAWLQVQTDSGLPAYWPDGEVRVKLSTLLPTGWSQAELGDLFTRAAAPWQEIGCFKFKLVDDGFAGPGLKSAFDGENWVMWVKDQWPFSSTQLAVTLVEFKQKTGEIIDADIFVNAEQKSFSLDPTCDPESPHIDLQGVMTHELGHLIGLDHSQVPFATMAVSTDTGDCTKRTLHQDDIDGFCATYTNLPAEAEPSPETEADAAGTQSEVAEADDPESGCTSGTPGAPSLFLLLLFGWFVRSRSRGFFTA